MTVDDTLAIHEMIGRYSYAYDAKDADAFAGIFLDDGVFEVFVPGQTDARVRLGSRAAIREWAAGRHRLNAASQARHYQSSVIVEELTPTTARAQAMLLLVRQGAHDAAPVVHLTGVYHDEWRKTREGWRLARRTARVDRDPGFA